MTQTTPITVASFQAVSTYRELPTEGQPGCVYFVVDTTSVYTWDSLSMSYKALEFVSEEDGISCDAEHELTRLPDGSAFFTASFPLPKSHWIYGPSGEPPMAMLTGTADPKRGELADMIRKAAKYAIRASTRSGRDMDFDPDAMVQNMVIAMLGYYTPDGTTNTSDLHAVVSDPNPEQDDEAKHG